GNALLEGLVFAGRIAEDLTARLAAGGLPRLDATGEGSTGLLDARHRDAVQLAMTRGVGPLRSAGSTARALADLAELADVGGPAEPGPASWETTNLLHLGQVLATAAHLREETRGGHVRTDYPHHDDEGWSTHLVQARDPGDPTGEVAVIRLGADLTRHGD